MLASNTQDLVDSLVDRCRAANEPVVGIFWLAEVFHLTRLGDLERLRETLGKLVEMALETPDRCLVLNNVQVMIDNALKMGLPALGSHFIDALQVQTPFPEHLCTGIACQEWSVMGMLAYCKHFEFFMCVTDAQETGTSLLKTLREPQAMPVSDELLAPHSFAQPLGQWIPAYQDSKGLIHDMLDLCTEARPEFFKYLTGVFCLFTNELPQTQAGYLARQAARAYDLAAYAARNCGPTYSINYAINLIGTSSHTSKIMRWALLQGARIPLRAWSGLDSNQSFRAFASPGGPLPELVHALTQGEAGHLKPEEDAQTAEALRCLRMNGHDIVILHQRDAAQNQQKRLFALPLHVCVQKGWSQSVALLLSAGADPMAKVYSELGNSCEIGKTAFDVAQSVAEKNSVIENMLYASEARKTATDVLRGMGLQGFGTPARS